MRTVSGTLAGAAGVVLGLVLTSAAHAQAPRAGVHRMEINNGATQTVRYFGVRLSPGESAALRDLERGENEVAYLHNLQNLKREYVSDERRLEAVRFQAQQDFYGKSMAASGYGGLGNFASLGLDSGYLAALNLRGSYGAAGLGGLYGGYYAPGLYSGLGYGYGSGLLGSGTPAAGLGYGSGIDDPIKASLASVIAQQATPQYAALVDRDLDRAIAQAGNSKTLSVALGLPDASRGRGGDAYIRPVAAETEPAAPVTVTLKNGTVLRGTKLEETKEWIIVVTGKGGKTRVRPTEVVRIDEGKSGVGPAVGD